MGWMTGKKSYSDWFFIGFMMGAGCIITAWQWLWERAIKGNAHWNESQQDIYDRMASNVKCNCRACKNI